MPLLRDKMQRTGPKQEFVSTHVHKLINLLRNDKVLINIPICADIPWPGIYSLIVIWLNGKVSSLLIDLYAKFISDARLFNSSGNSGVGLVKSTINVR